MRRRDGRQRCHRTCEVLSSNVSARRSHSFAAAQRRQCTLVASPQLPSYDDRQPQGKEPKLSDLGVTRRNPDIVRDSEGPSGTAARALFPAGATGLTTPGGHGTLRRGRESNRRIRETADFEQRCQPTHRSRGFNLLHHPRHGPFHSRQLTKPEFPAPLPRMRFSVSVISPSPQPRLGRTPSLNG
jgi:hypothetical protein